MHILRLNCAETIQDRPGQPAYEIKLRTAAVACLMSVSSDFLYCLLCDHSARLHCGSCPGVCLSICLSVQYEHGNLEHNRERKTVIGVNVSGAGITDVQILV